MKQDTEKVWPFPVMSEAERQKERERVAEMKMDKAVEILPDLFPEGTAYILIVSEPGTDGNGQTTAHVTSNMPRPSFHHMLKSLADQSAESEVPPQPADEG